ncbi:hypothetical protein AB1K56_08905 [Microbacterium sp. BWR-S6Y]|uniref:hypothetical protein n=1 Tax=Microbacterium sp. BWR-S6Y TaxID=3232073 RepID=UPI00352998F2
MEERSARVSARVRAATLALAGIILGLSGFVAGRTAAELSALWVGLSVGFAALVVSMLTERRSTRGVGGGVALTAAVVWLIGWLWPWTWGLVLWVPFGLFGAIAGLLFGAAAITVAARDRLAGLRLSLLSAGSLGSSVVAFSDVIFTPPFVFVPLGVAALIAGAAGSHWRVRANPAVTFTADEATGNLGGIPLPIREPFDAA